MGILYFERKPFEIPFTFIFSLSTSLELLFRRVGGTPGVRKVNGSRFDSRRGDSTGGSRIVGSLYV